MALLENEARDFHSRTSLNLRDFFIYLIQRQSETGILRLKIVISLK